jgi:hypothetical protein
MANEIASTTKAAAIIEVRTARPTASPTPAGPPGGVTPVRVHQHDDRRHVYASDERPDQVDGVEERVEVVVVHAGGLAVIGGTGAREVGGAELSRCGRYWPRSTDHAFRLAKVWVVPQTPKIDWVRRYALSPSGPPSLPIPLDLTPPKGVHG